MSVLTGKDGTMKINGVIPAPISNWKLTKTSNNPDYAANDTAGWKKRRPGIKDCKGSFDLKIDGAKSCPVEIGDEVTLVLYVDGTANNNYYTVPAIIDEIAVEVDINGGGIEAFAVAFSGNGAVTATGAVAYVAGGSGS